MRRTRAERGASELRLHRLARDRRAHRLRPATRSCPVKIATSDVRRLHAGGGRVRLDQEPPADREGDPRQGEGARAFPSRKDNLTIKKTQGIDHDRSALRDHGRLLQRRRTSTSGSSTRSSRGRSSTSDRAVVERRSRGEAARGGALDRGGLPPDGDPGVDAPLLRAGDAGALPDPQDAGRAPPVCGRGRRAVRGDPPADRDGGAPARARCGASSPRAATTSRCGRRSRGLRAAREEDGWTLAELARRVAAPRGTGRAARRGLPPGSGAGSEGQ